MNKTAASASLLHLLIKVHNQLVQSYYYFPEVIICGRHRLERYEFDLLLAEGLIICHNTDSFGKLYHLSKKGEYILHQSLVKRRRRLTPRRTLASHQFLLF